MKIKRYFAPDIRQAMRMVKEEQGPDAVILSNRRVEGGVEIVAAHDFDEQALHDKLSERIDTPAPEVAKPVPKAPPAPPPPAAPPPPTRPSVVDPSVGLPPSGAAAELLARLRAQGVEPPPPAASAAPLNVSRPSWADEPAAPLRADFNPQRASAANHASRPPPNAADFHNPAAARPNPSAADYHSPRMSPAPSLRDLPPSALAASADNEALAEIRREMRQLRKVMDFRLAEVGWQASSQSNVTRLELLRDLRERGFSKTVALHLANRLGGLPDLDSAWPLVKEILARQLPVVEDSLLDYGGIAALVGPTGVGKTTTVAKLAAKFRLKHGPRQLALITVDNYRIAAHEQLYTYGRILDVPVAIASDAAELQQALQGFLDKKLVLIDTAGMGQHDRRLQEQMNMLASSRIPIKPYLVLSAASQLRALEDVVRVFGVCRPHAAILTKLDEAAQPAAALSVLMNSGLPVAFTTDGQQVPEALHAARADDLIERCFNAAWDEDDTDARAFTFDEWVSHGGR